MADEAPQSQSVDFWSELEEAHQTVEQWPEWQQRYEADVNADHGRSGCRQGNRA